MTTIRFQNVSKKYTDGTVALDGISFNVEPGEFIVFVGPSGCGKTTTLRLIAGLETPSSGSIHLDGVDAGRMQPHQRHVGMVFQRAALLPHLRVVDALCFPGRIKSWPKSMFSAKHSRTNPPDGAYSEQLCDFLRLQPFLARFPDQLSGGELQRAAIARAVIRRPKILLLDEPFSNVDALFKSQLRQDVLNLHKQLGTTTICVSHDPDDAATLADRVVIMAGGRILQVGQHREILTHPRSVEVAKIVHPSWGSYLHGNLTATDKGAIFRYASWKLPLPKCVVHDKMCEREVTVWVPAQAVRVVQTAPGGAYNESASTGVPSNQPGEFETFHEMTVEKVEYTYPCTWLTLRHGDVSLTAQHWDGASCGPLQPGQNLIVGLNTAAIVVFDAASGLALTGN